MQDQLRVAMFTPLPPAWTGTADYAASLIAEMDKLVALHVYQRVPRSFRPDGFDAVIYHIANNPYHAAFYKAALRHPGVVVLHEPNLHDLVKSMTLNSGNESAYLREVVYEIFGHELSEVVTDTSLYQCPQPRTFGILRRLLSNAAGCIVHSSYAEQAVRTRNFQGALAVVPHGATVRNLDAGIFRASLGLAPGVPIIGIHGYQRPDKRSLECLQVFSALRRSVPDAHMVVVGVAHPEVDLETSVREMGLEQHVSLLGFQQSLEIFDGYLAACDVVVNLRNPTFGETSGTMMRAFGLGKTVIVSDNGSNSDLPDEICLRIPDDAHEGRVLLECLKWLLSEPSLTHEIGSRAQQWVAGRCSWSRVANMYVSFLENSIRGKPAPPELKPSQAGRADAFRNAADTARYLERWIDPESDAAGYFATHARRLARTLQLTPPGAAEDRILEMGCYFQITPALQRVLGYGEVRGCYLGSADGGHLGSVAARDGEEFECTVDLFNAEADIFPYPD
jgi:glycosyltransferase involved in cell wall biosynthesis